MFNWKHAFAFALATASALLIPSRATVAHLLALDQPTGTLPTAPRDLSLAVFLAPLQDMLGLFQVLCVWSSPSLIVSTAFTRATRYWREVERFLYALLGFLATGSSLGLRRKAIKVPVDPATKAPGDNENEDEDIGGPGDDKGPRRAPPFKPVLNPPLPPLQWSDYPSGFVDEARSIPPVPPPSVVTPLSSHSSSPARREWFRSGLAARDNEVDGCRGSSDSATYGSDGSRALSDASDDLSHGSDTTFTFPAEPVPRPARAVPRIHGHLSGPAQSPPGRPLMPAQEDDSLPGVAMVRTRRSWGRPRSAPTAAMAMAAG
ncbi:hypothetical protein Q8F55_000566 [Vanrija albida]|uniref:Uncharacterized protein n=1 Tax=Vanrija albida TaxID=181172 RepID=A0ABR3QEI5_9TREE